MPIYTYTDSIYIYREREIHIYTETTALTCHIPVPLRIHKWYVCGFITPPWPDQATPEEREEAIKALTKYDTLTDDESRQRFTHLE